MLVLKRRGIRNRSPFLSNLLKKTPDELGVHYIFSAAQIDTLRQYWWVAAYKEQQARSDGGGGPTLTAGSMRSLGSEQRSRPPEALRTSTPKKWFHNAQCAGIFRIFQTQPAFPERSERQQNDHLTDS
jgi:hypothetical protein